MKPITRRALLGLAAVTGVSAAGAAVVHQVRPAAGTAPPPYPAPPKTTPRTVTGWTFDAQRSGPTIIAENMFTGAGPDAWRAGPASGTAPSDDLLHQIEGYASATSVRTGGPIDFHVSGVSAGPATIAVYRIGHYGGAGSRLMATSAPIELNAYAIPDPTGNGEIACAWPVAARLPIPADWMPGLYIAAFTARDRHRAITPFVVRSDKPTALCAVLPFTTYQAYNMWPMDRKLGKSLYLGYDARGDGDADLRAHHVSFARPYHRGGDPRHLDDDIAFIRWAESVGYSLTYATSVDLHAGRVIPTRYRGLVFSGHDEYWSDQMRAAVVQAQSHGVNMAFLSANSMYWRVRISGTDHQTVECYKHAADPSRDALGGTTMWRYLGHAEEHSEQQVLGTQFTGIPSGDSPMIVTNPGHWVWAGTGLVADDRIEALVGGEIDALTPDAPRAVGGAQTLLSESPCVRAADGAPLTQQTSVWETPAGGVVFNAGTFNWTRALSTDGHVDPRIQRATHNVLDRMMRPTSA